MNLEHDYTYYRNYESGNCSIKEGKINLVPREDLGLPPIQYEVISSSDATLTLEVTLAEKEYRQSFEGIAEDEIITVTEKYVRK